MLSRNDEIFRKNGTDKKIEIIIKLKIDSDQ
jgi:hypothetical protein